jgi:hypothetical protein
MKLSKIDVWVILSFSIPFGISMLTLAPSVTFFDSGEFLTAIASLGSAHSPGYPLFLMFAKPFTWIPLGNIAFRINMATAFSASLACMGVYLLTVFLLKDEHLVEDRCFSTFVIKASGVAAACSFSVTPRLWLQSNHDKPYPLLAFMSAIIFYLLLKWREHYEAGNERPAYVYVCTFLAGMAMGLHQTIVLLLPAWFLLIVLTDWRMLTRIKELVLATAFAMAGFSINIYLPIRATQNPLLNWGDAKSSTQFLWHFLRKGYPDDPHARDLALLWAQIKAFNVPREFTWMGAALVLFALFCLWRRHRDVVIAYLAAVGTFLLVIVGHFNALPDFIFLTEEFFTPLYLLSAVLVGVGLFHVLRYTISHARIPERIDAKVYILVLILLFSLPVSLCAVNYYENDQHNNYIAYDYASNSLRSLPQNAVMFTWGDSGAFPLWYLQGIERMREDLDLPHTPHIVFDWYLDSLPRVFKDSNLRKFNIQNSPPEVSLRIAVNDVIDQRPVYIDFSTRYSVEFTDYVPVQKGIVYRLLRISEPRGLPDVSVWQRYNNRGILEKISFLDLDTGKAIMIYANSYLEAGEFLVSIKMVGEGLQMLDKAELIAPTMRASKLQVLRRYGIER